AGGLGDVVVVALGTNDAGLYRESTWVAHWNGAMRLAGGRPVLFLTSQARPGDRRHAPQAAYSQAPRTWCASTPRCSAGDWAATAVANDPAAYVDGVHLTMDATRARARFVRDAVAAVLAGRDPAAVAPPTTTTIAAAPSTTTASTVVTTTSTVPPATPTTTLAS